MPNSGFTRDGLFFNLCFLLCTQSISANLTSLFGLLSKELLVLVAIVFLIASPLAGWLFAIAGALAILMALITLRFQTMKALLANQMNS